MKRIDSLTEEQKALFPEFVQKWIKIGLSTDEANWKEFEEGVRECYTLSNLAKPKFIIKAASPWAFVQALPYCRVFAANLKDAQVHDQVGAQVRAQVHDQVGAQVHDQVRAQVYDQVDDQVDAQVYDQVDAQVHDQVGAQVHDQVRAQVHDQVGAQVHDQVRAQVHDQVDDQVDDQVRAQVGDQVYDQVRDQVRAQVYAQVHDQVRAQVHAQVRDQVYAQVDDQVDDQVRAQVRAQVHDQVGDQVDDQVDAQVYDQVDAQVHDQVGAQVHDQVDDQVRAQVGDQVYDQVYAQVDDQVDDQVRAQVHDQVGDLKNRKYNNWYKYLGGGYWSGWQAYIDYFVSLGLELPEDKAKKQKAYEKAQSGGNWWYPQTDFAILVNRPKEIHRDDRNRLHHESKMAIWYRDGWGFYCWHGVRVPAWIITNPETITAAAIDKEANQEIKRVMIERFGLHKYVQTGTKIHQDDFGTLYQKPIDATDIKLTMVHVVNGSKEPDGTYKDYFLEVHPELRPLHEDGTEGEPQKMTAKNAVASTYGMRGEEYLVTVRT